MRIEYLHTGFNRDDDPPELGGGRYQELINNYQIKEDEIWDSGCGIIINIWGAICDGRIKETDYIPNDDLEFFMNHAIYNEILFLRYA